MHVLLFLFFVDILWIKFVIFFLVFLTVDLNCDKHNFFLICGLYFLDLTNIGTFGTRQ